MLNLIKPLGLGLGVFKSSGVIAPPNLLAGLSWTAGTNTTLSVAGGKARATIGGGANPRIQKNPTGMVNGATYYINGRIYIGTCATVRLRISPNTGLPDGAIFEYIQSSDFLFVNTPFVMQGTACFVGPVGISGAAGQYVEIDDLISITATPI